VSLPTITLWNLNLRSRSRDRVPCRALPRYSRILPPWRQQIVYEYLAISIDLLIISSGFTIPESFLEVIASDHGFFDVVLHILVKTL
jgi:hypothetical protein